MKTTRATRPGRPGRVGLTALAGAALSIAAATPAASAVVAKERAGTKASVRAQPRAPNAVGRPAAGSLPPGDPQQVQALQSAERDRLTARIAALKQQIAAGEKSRSGAAAALARAEQALAKVNHRIDELAQRQRAAQDRVARIDEQRVGTETQITVRQAEAALVLNRLYANRDRSPLRTYVAGGDPGAGLLEDTYLRYILQAQASDLNAMRGRVGDLQAQRQRADEDTRALGAQADAQRAAREALAADQDAQKQALAQLSKKLVEQRTTASALEADEQRLTRVVEQLQRAIDRQVAEAKARREEAARRLAEQQAAAKRNRSATAGHAPVSPSRDEAPPARVEAVPDDTVNGDFARLRGQLRLPVRGSITGRYGAPRGSGGGTWKGVFVKTDAGAEIRAVAAGRIVFADDLRGFGNLLIVDHGDQYLSIYGNNETLLRHTGDTVRPGDVISRAGNSSGDDQTGLYFELRFRGRPFDPMTWTGGR